MILKTQVFVQYDLLHAGDLFRQLAIPGEQQLRPDALVMQDYRNTADRQIDKSHIRLVIQQAVATAGIEQAVAQPVQNKAFPLLQLLVYPTGDPGEIRSSGNVDGRNDNSSVS